MDVAEVACEDELFGIGKEVSNGLDVAILSASNLREYRLVFEKAIKLFSGSKLGVYLFLEVPFGTHEGAVSNHVVENEEDDANQENNANFNGDFYVGVHWLELTSLAFFGGDSLISIWIWKFHPGVPSRFTL